MKQRSAKSVAVGKSKASKGTLMGRLQRTAKRMARRLVNLDLFSADFSNVPPIATRTAPEAQIERTSAGGGYSRLNSTETAPAIAPSPLNKSANGAALPAVDELYRLFDLYNLLHFDGRLPKVRIAYSTRMLAAGSCTPSTKEIRIGLRYHQLFPDDLSDTLQHEMIHLVHFYHDQKFITKARELGVSIKAKSHPSLRRPARYLYHCPSCAREYPRQKRLRLASCGYCTPTKRYDERYKLRLRK